MVSLTFYFEGKTDDDNWPGAVIARISDFTPSAIPDVPGILVEQIEVFYNNDWVIPHLGACAIKFELGPGLIISERAFWGLVIDLSPAPERAIIDYVDAHIVQCGGELAFTSQMDVAGQEALYAYFDIVLGRDQPPNADKTGIDNIVDCFMRFLENCDMDHETYQNYYINLVLSKIRRDPDRFLKLLAFRLFNGQLFLSSGNIDYDTIQRYVNRQGILKKLIDLRLSQSGVSAIEKYHDVLELCAPVYGNDTDAIEDVLRYCRQQTELDETPRKRERWLPLTRDLRDVHLRFQPPGMQTNTGFHVRTSDGDWESII